MKTCSLCSEYRFFILLSILPLLLSLLFQPTHTLATELQTAISTDLNAEKKFKKQKIQQVKLTHAAIRKRIDIVNQNQKLSVDARKKIINYYNEALKSLDRQQIAINETIKYTKLIENKKSATKPEFTLLQAVRPRVIEQKARSMALTDIEGTIAEFQAQLAAEQTKLELTQKLQSQLLSKPIELRKKIASYEDELNTLQFQLDNPIKTDKSPRIITARRTRVRAKCAELKAELKVSEHEVERSKHEQIQINNKLATISRKAVRLERLLKAWSQVKDSRQTDTGYTELRQNIIILTELNKQTFSHLKINFLKQLTNRNIAIAKIIIEVSQLGSEADKALQMLDSRYKLIEQDFSTTKRRIKMMGLTRKSGQILQAKRATLLTNCADSKIAKKRNQDILNANLNSDDILQESQNFLPYKDEIYNQLDNMGGKVSENENNVLTTQAYILLESYRKLLEEVSKGYTEYIADLNKQQITQKNIDSASQDFRTYINQRLLWASSSPIYSISSITGSSKAVLWLVDKSNWKHVTSDIYTSIIQKTTFWILVIIMFIASISLQFFLPKQINSINKFASQPLKDSVGRTIGIVLLVIIQAGCIPFIINMAAYYILTMNTVHIFTRALCIGITSVTSIAIIFNVIIIFCKEDGVGIKNFKWSKIICAYIRKFLIVFFIIVMPFFFFTVILQNGLQNLNFRSTLGRSLSIIITFIVLILFVNGVKTIRNFRNKTGIVGWIKKYYLWLNIIIIALPVFLIVLSLVGYYFTAYEFAKNISSTFFLIIIILLAYEILGRILFLAQTHIDQKKAELERKAEKEKRKLLKASPQDQNSNIADDLNLDIVDPIIEKEELNEQTSQLIHFIMLIALIVGVIVIWSDFFPSISFLNNLEVWNTQISTGKDGVPIYQQITLFNIIEALLTFICTIIVVRNIAALIEILIFRGKKFHPGTRHAYELISKYILAGIGFFLGLKFLGIGWAQFQYLAAAMTLGISFGLKDIFANFISGIIILIERPIRLGDSVTVAGSNGTVTRIRIRSTTITDFDRHELIVPNQAFLTEKIVNWSLSDQIIRIVVDIGIGYSSNAAEAETILLQIAKDNSMVLDTPKPSVIFVGFGADSLDFKLRSYVNLSDQMTAQHKIRHEINNRFKEAGIEIPFAQRDIHINSNEGPLKIEVVEKKVL